MGCGGLQDHIAKKQLQITEFIREEGFHSAEHSCIISYKNVV